MRVLLLRCFVVRRKLRTVFKSVERYFVARSISFPGFKYCFTVEKDGMGEQKRKCSSLVYSLVAAKAAGGGGHLSTLVLNTNKKKEKGLMRGSPCHGQLSTNPSG
jgi:hypothetical protein